MTRERRGNVALSELRRVFHYSRFALTVPLTAWKSTAVWTGQITVGTPPQKLQIYFDTGSCERLALSFAADSPGLTLVLHALADLTVADSTCWKSKCGTKARYTVSKSSTAVKTSQKTTTNYVDGSTSTGTLIRDNLVAGGLTLKNQAIITSTSLSTTVADLDADGLAGLAWPALGTSGTTSIPFTQLDQGKTNGVFSLALSNTDGVSSIYFGGWQSARLSGSFSFYPVGKSAGSSSNTYWQISNSAPYLNGILAQSTRVNMIFDSGTTLIIAPAAAAKAFWARVLGAKKMDDNFWTFPCAKPPTVAFGFNKQAKQFAVSAESELSHRSHRLSPSPPPNHSTFRTLITSSSVSSLAASHRVPVLTRAALLSPVHLLTVQISRSIQPRLPT